MLLSVLNPESSSAIFIGVQPSKTRLRHNYLYLTAIRVALRAELCNFLTADKYVVCVDEG